MLSLCQVSAGPLVMQWRKQGTGGKAHSNAQPRLHLASKPLGRTRLTMEKLEWWDEDVLIQDC